MGMSYGKVVIVSLIGILTLMQPVYFAWAMRTWPLFAPTTAVRLGICALSQDVCERAALLTGTQDSSTKCAAREKERREYTDVVSDLERLAVLRRDGMLDDAEFAAAKRCVLDNIVGS